MKRILVILNVAALVIVTAIARYDQVFRKTGVLTESGHFQRVLTGDVDKPTSIEIYVPETAFHVVAAISALVFLCNAIVISCGWIKFERLNR